MELTSERRKQTTDKHMPGSMRHRKWLTMLLQTGGQERPPGAGDRNFHENLYGPESSQVGLGQEHSEQRERPYQEPEMGTNVVRLTNSLDPLRLE